MRLKHGEGTEDLKKEGNILSCITYKGLLKKVKKEGVTFSNRLLLFMVYFILTRRNIIRKFWKKLRTK